MCGNGALKGRLRQEMGEKAMSQKSKYQKFEFGTINRQDILNAEYNPRILDTEAEKRLKKGLKEHGLVSGITWNRRTKRCVSGHQRLRILDSLERNQDYSLDVCIVDCDEKEEAALNVQLNNQSMMGDWDLEKLIGMSDDFDLDFVDDMGFSKLDVDTMFDGLFSDAYETPEREEVTTKIDELKAVREKSREQYKENAKLNYYTIIVFADEEEKRAFHKKINVPFSEEYITTSQLERLEK